MSEVWLSQKHSLMALAMRFTVTVWLLLRFENVVENHECQKHSLILTKILKAMANNNPGTQKDIRTTTKVQKGPKFFLQVDTPCAIIVEYKATHDKVIMRNYSV